MDEKFNVSEAIVAQDLYCMEKHVPHFAPRTGICWRCNKNIYKQVIHEKKDWKTNEVTGYFTTGISVERAGRELITGCPHCNRSYCD